MNKNITKYTIFILFFLILGLNACSSKNTTIEAKYISIYDKNNYLTFNKDGSFQNNYWTITSGNKTRINDCYIYTIDENNIITVIDTTDYEGQDYHNKYEIGIMYKEYICVKWDGEFSTDYIDMSITNTLEEDLILICNFKSDKTYEFITNSKNEIVDSENGTYSINGNELNCLSNEGLVTTFVCINGNAYCFEYIKE